MLEKLATMTYQIIKWSVVCQKSALYGDGLNSTDHSYGEGLIETLKLCKTYYGFHIKYLVMVQDPHSLHWNYLHHFEQILHF